MKSVQLVFIVHVMILASHVSECSIAHVALVNCFRVSASQMISERLWLREALLANMTSVWDLIIEISIVVGVSVQLQMFLQLQTLVECLTTHFTHWTDLSGVFPHVIQQIFFLSKHVATRVTLVLDSASVDGDMLLQTVETRELSAADGATEEAAVILLSITSVLYLRNFIIDLVVASSRWRGDF